MIYETKIISSRDELHTCNLFHVNTLLWGTSAIPPTYGRLGFVPEDGFYLTMTCEESQPQKHCTANQGGVCLDSAMEMFLQFFPEHGNSNIYLNFELNAAGAIHAKYGNDRINRLPFPITGRYACEWSCSETENSWSIMIRIPLCALEQIYGSLNLKEGSMFACNFYKISETPEIEHYASYAPISAPEPDFHLPEFFAKAILV